MGPAARRIVSDKMGPCLSVDVHCVVFVIRPAGNIPLQPACLARRAWHTLYLHSWLILHMGGRLHRIPWCWWRRAVCLSPSHFPPPVYQNIPGLDTSHSLTICNDPFPPTHECELIGLWNTHPHKRGPQWQLIVIVMDGSCSKGSFSFVPFLPVCGSWDLSLEI